MIQSYQFHNSVRDLYAVLPNRDIAETLAKIGIRKDSDLRFYSTLYNASSLRDNMRGSILHISLPYGEMVDGYFSKAFHDSHVLKNHVDIPSHMIQAIII